MKAGSKIFKNADYQFVYKDIYIHKKKNIHSMYIFIITVSILLPINGVYLSIVRCVAGDFTFAIDILYNKYITS